MSGTAAVGSTFASTVTATGLQLDNNFSTIVAYLNDPTNRNNYAADAGATNTVVTTFAPPVVGGYSAGLEITFKAAATNSGGVVVNANGVGNANLVNPDGSALWAGQLTQGSIGKAAYDGTRFIFLSGATFGDYRSSQVYATSTVYVKPAGLKRVRVFVMGGGAGGGGAVTSAVAAGGCSAGWAIKTIAAASLAATETVTIGSAGTGGAAGNNAGNNGGTTSFGSHVSATGGTAGSGAPAASASGVNGGPGVGTGGDVNASGMTGQSGNLNQLHGGVGGGSMMGGARQNYTDTNGNNADGYGAGGTGAATGGGSNRAGGNGSPGIAIIEEFF